MSRKLVSQNPDFQDRETLHGTHVAPEATRDGVGLSDPIERCLASTSRDQRRRVGRELQMAENLADHLDLGDGSDRYVDTYYNSAWIKEQGYQLQPYLEQLRHCYTTTEWPELSMSLEGAYQPEDEGLNGRHGGLGFL